MMKKLFITLLFVLSSTFSIADDDHEHKHNMVEANAPYPTLDVELIKDTKDGYNLIIQTTNFKFAPENVNQANNGNEGHAHIYINDVKYRQYSPYFHLSNNLLEKGENEIKVTLNANDHGHLMANGMPLTYEIELMADGKYKMKKGHKHKKDHEHKEH
mgnify:FL=1